MNPKQQDATSRPGRPHMDTTTRIPGSCDYCTAGHLTSADYLVAHPQHLHDTDSIETGFCSGCGRTDLRRDDWRIESFRSDEPANEGMGVTIQRYAVTLYHDEPEEASTDSQSMYPFSRFEDAKRWAQEHITEYWQTASIERGEFHEATHGRRPAWFDWETAPGTIARVGLGWVER